MSNELETDVPNIDLLMCRLLDNDWQIYMSRGVDRVYLAAAKKVGTETWKDIFETVNKDGQPCGFPMDDFERQHYKGHRMPHRIGYGKTPAEAIAEMADKVLGISKEPSNE